MDRSTLHRSIIASEYFWYGGVLDAPKVYDPGTHHSAQPQLRGSADAGRRLSGSGSGGAGTEYILTVDLESDVWNVGPIVGG